MSRLASIAEHDYAIYEPFTLTTNDTKLADSFIMLGGKDLGVVFNFTTLIDHLRYISAKLTESITKHQELLKEQVFDMLNDPIISYSSSDEVKDSTCEDLNSYISSARRSINELHLILDENHECLKLHERLIRDLIVHKLPLHIATERGYYKTVETLVDLGANINAYYSILVNETGKVKFDKYTPIRIAAKNLDHRMIFFLMDRGAHFTKEVANSYKTSLSEKLTEIVSSCDGDSVIIDQYFLFNTIYNIIPTILDDKKYKTYVEAFQSMVSLEYISSYIIRNTELFTSISSNEELNELYLENRYDFLGADSFDT